jgi:hypothetical protein
MRLLGAMLLGITLGGCVGESDAEPTHAPMIRHFVWYASLATDRLQQTAGGAESAEGRQVSLSQ